MKLVFLVCLLFVAASADLSLRSPSVCFYGGEVPVSGVSSTEEIDFCQFGDVKSKVEESANGVVCVMPPRPVGKVAMSIVSNGQEIPKGMVEILDCVEAHSDDSCPGDYPEVVLTAPKFPFIDYQCVWNKQRAQEPTRLHGQTLSCSIPYDSHVSSWSLTLKARHNGVVGESSELLSYSYRDCPNDIPHIIGIGSEVVVPWGQDLSISTEGDRKRDSTKEETPVCRFISGQTTHLSLGVLQDNGDTNCHTPVLPLGDTLVELSWDGRTWSSPFVISTESSITSVKGTCDEGKAIVKIFSDKGFSPEVDYSCFFGNIQTTGSIDTPEVLVCPGASGYNGVVSLLVHDRKNNRATAFQLGDMTFNC